jgi:hypothetical protein
LEAVLEALADLAREGMLDVDDSGRQARLRTLA